jgi:hypothetical protein
VNDLLLTVSILGAALAVFLVVFVILILIPHLMKRWDRLVKRSAGQKRQIKE